MRKIIFFILAVLVAFAVSACGRVPPPPAAETDPIPEGSRILIAYFTWAENTYVENPEEIDIDAATSASVLPPGNAAILAGWIQEATGGDIFSIVAAEPYPSNFNENVRRVSQEQAADARPELTARVENMDEYDVIFLGFPIWSNTCPAAILTFLEDYDFSGKTIVPFVAHGDGGVGESIRDISALLPNSTILEEIGINRRAIAAAQPRINEWLAGFGIDQ